ncbi:leukocyte surface antigen CD53-like [Teleopsis dalmanni]|uniref:leukocyte surface antigen CD53-like n=1 Tax=Teleopsis dalmanni TaxID=139649 RepID=UPI0018CD874A|nr:leukocyte surface antigen CD53-like [Teleopsis dalmanni]
MNCLAKVIKYILFVFNLLLLISSLFFIIWFGIVLGYMVHVDNDVGYQILPIVVIVMASICFIASFLGCFGSIRNNICLLKTYSIVMIILCCIEVIVIILIFVTRQQISKTDVNSKDMANIIGGISIGIAGIEALAALSGFYLIKSIRNNRIQTSVEEFQNY